MYSTNAGATPFMNDEQYREHCCELIQAFARSLEEQTGQLPKDDPLCELAAGFGALGKAGAALYEDGPALVARLFTTYPELAPSLPRQLLWFFGGDCLHYMPDEEINRFARLDEMRAEASARGETLNLRDARAKLLNLQ